jgi:hypothetical protein
MSGHGLDDSTARDGGATSGSLRQQRRSRARRRCAESQQGAASHDAGRTPSPQLADGDPSRAFRHLPPSETRAPVSRVPRSCIRQARTYPMCAAALLCRFRSPDCHIAAGVRRRPHPGADRAVAPEVAPRRRRIARPSLTGSDSLGNGIRKLCIGSASESRARSRSR